MHTAYWISVGNDLPPLPIRLYGEQKARLTMEQGHDGLELRAQGRTLVLKKSHKQVLHLEKLAAEGNFSASIAHAFDNPLHSLMTII